MKTFAIVSVPEDQEETGCTAAILAGSIATGTAISTEVLLDPNTKNSWLRLLRELQSFPGYTLKIHRTRAYCHISGCCQISEVVRNQVRQIENDTVIVIVQPDNFDRLKRAFLQEDAIRPDENILIVKLNGSP